MPQQTQQQQQQQQRRIRHRPGRVLASVPLDDLMEAATRYARQNGIQDPWVREVWTDKVIVMGGDADDASGYGDDLFEIDWTDTDGTLAFTGPWEVRVEYQRINDQDGDPWDKPGPGVVTVAPDDGNAPATAAASARPGDSGSRPVRYVRGRGDVSASTPEEQSPVSDLAAQVRERLGLPPDASDDAVTTALEQRLGTAEQPGTGPTQTPDGGATAPASTEPAGQPVAASAPELEQLVAQRVEAAVAPFRDQLAETSRELAERKERERNASREQLLASAVSAGKITPADRVKWAALYDKGPAEASAVEQVFASLAAGTAVPTATTPGAHTGGDAPTGDSISDAEYRALFGDEKAGAV